MCCSLSRSFGSLASAGCVCWAKTNHGFLNCQQPLADIPRRPGYNRGIAAAMPATHPAPTRHAPAHLMETTRTKKHHVLAAIPNCTPSTTLPCDKQGAPLHTRRLRKASTAKPFVNHSSQPSRFAHCNSPNAQEMRELSCTPARVLNRLSRFDAKKKPATMTRCGLGFDVVPDIGPGICLDRIRGGCGVSGRRLPAVQRRHPDRACH